LVEQLTLGSTTSSLMPRFSVLGSFAAEEIADRVPPDFRALVREYSRTGASYTVILFLHDRGQVNTSALVRRALTRVPPDATVLAVGADFTKEATALLEERNALIARIGEFGWTDESYQSVRHPAH
jgi:hypothetical protein